MSEGASILHIKLLFFLSLLVFVGCSDKARVEVREGSVLIESSSSKIDNFELVEWKVGAKRKQIIHRGFIISFKAPDLSSEAKTQIYEKLKADSWLFRLKKDDKTLGNFAMQFVSPLANSKGLLRFDKSSRASVTVNYAAASLSTRLDQVPCPVLDHRLFIDDIDLKTATRRFQLVASSSESYPVPGKVETISFSPITVNGGMRLVGQYSLEIALYRSKTRKRLSRFVEASNIVNIQSEKSIPLKGCSGYELPEKKERNPVKEFKFGG